MANPVSALAGARFDQGIAEVRELAPQGMITLRGDLSEPSIRSAATAVAKVDFPDANHVVCAGDRGIAWMSPDEVLILCPYAEVGKQVAQMNQTLTNYHMLAANVSDARAVFQVSGPNAREVMAKLTPVDLDPALFVPGMFRRTRMAQIAAAFWMQDAQTFQIICFRSNARYLFDLLCVAAQPGSEVGVF